MRPATIAAEKPDTGVEIKTKSAYFVIRDCADVTQKYLSLLCYASYSDPIKQLKGKFTKTEIIDFVARARSNKEFQARQLLCTVFADINNNRLIPQSQEMLKQTVVVTSEDEDVEDIYGDYDYVDVVTTTEDEETTWMGVDTEDETVLINVLCDVFTPAK